MAAVASSTHHDLLKTLTSAPHAFLQPPTALHASSLSFLKETLDPIAASVAETQQQRLQDDRKKRKRGQEYEDEDVLRLKKVHVDGFAIEQVWEQARRVIEAARHEAELGLEAVAFAQQIDSEEDDDEDSSSEIGAEGVDWEYDGEDIDGEDDEDVDATMEDGEEDDDEEVEEDDEDLDMGSEASDEDVPEDEPAQEYVPDPNGLNDGFFSIDDFNRQSEFLEQADARGANDGDASDEEDVDWDADPLGTSTSAAKPVGKEDDGEDEDGPTFGNVDLNAPEGFSDDDDEEIEEGEMDDMGAMSNTNNIKYADFFAPPAQKARKNKKGRPNPHNFPAKQEKAPQEEEEQDDDIERTMSAVHRDLFEESDEEEVPEEDLDPADPRSRRSTHERRRAALQEEIRRLEAANVAKREWTLSGEARAADRPLNSLLEEDLEFERAGKPVPVITAEISESIEELIKRRILAHEFNDILRRRPDDLATGRDARRGRQDFELADTKNKQSLSEMYEQEHLARTDPNHVSATDEKTAKEQKEIEALWRNIAGKLDSLSSLHFKPSQPALQLDIRVDAPVVRLEDARPTLGADAAGASQLAPQEIYKAGEAISKGEEVATRGGGVVAREEMGREERKRRRRREKEREKKAGGNEDKKKESKGAKERREIVGDLKKGNVKVIGRKGELTNVEGEAVKSGDGYGITGGSFKL